MEALSDPAKTFDTSGKSAALIHHHAICKMPMALPDNGLFGAIAGKNSLPTIEVAPVRHSERSPARHVAARYSRLQVNMRKPAEPGRKALEIATSDETRAARAGFRFAGRQSFSGGKGSPIRPPPRL